MKIMGSTNALDDDDDDECSAGDLWYSGRRTVSITWFGKSNAQPPRTKKTAAIASWQCRALSVMAKVGIEENGTKHCSFLCEPAQKESGVLKLVNFQYSKW
jgi:hypothetical protein